MLQLDGYIRVSKVGDRQGDSFISPDVQENAIDGWGTLREVKIVMQPPDLDRSGTVLSRPSLDRIIERIRAGETGGIAVARIDRLSRAGVVDALQLIAEIVDAGGKVAVIDLGIDPTTIFGEFAITIMLALARMQSRQIGQNWFVARERRIEAGGFVGGFVPPGYVKGEDKRLSPDPAFRESLISELFERRSARESWGKLADWLSEQLGEDVSATRVRSLMQCRTYLGESHGGQGLVNRAAHKPLVSRGLFEAANAIRGVVPARSGNATSLLSGIVRCAGCRYAMKANMRKASNGERVIELRCKSTKRERTCACEERASILAHRLEDLVLEQFFARVGEYRLQALESTAATAAAEGRIVEAEAELDAALDTRLAEALGGAESDRYIELVANRRHAVDEAIVELAALQDSGLDLPDVDLEEVWPELELHERRRLLRSALDCVFVRRGGGRDVVARTHFCWRGEAPELPTSGRRWTPTPFSFPP